jgi:hypothetical protein
MLSRGATQPKNPRRHQHPVERAKAPEARVGLGDFPNLREKPRPKSLQERRADLADRLFGAPNV